MHARYHLGQGLFAIGCFLREGEVHESAYWAEVGPMEDGGKESNIEYKEIH